MGRGFSRDIGGHRKYGREKKVKFCTTLDSSEVQAVFDLQNMVRDGKPDL